MAICEQCYQNPVCEMKGDPNTVEGLLGRVQETPISPLECFFHCCKTGVIDAVDALRKARRGGSQKQELLENQGLLPVGTVHKPFIPKFGRYVVTENNVLGLQEGDVVVFMGDYKKLTNVFEFRPPK